MPSALVIRLSSLGDVVLTQPVLQAAAQAGYDVDFFTKPVYQPLGALLPGVARTLASPEGLAPRYDLVLDLHGTARARRLVARVRAQRVLHYCKHSLARRLLVRPWGHPVFWNAWAKLDARSSVVDWYAQAAQRAQIAVAERRPRLSVPEQAQQAAAKLLAGLGLKDSQPWVALAPGAKWATKQWPREYFSQLAVRLDRETGIRPVLIGGESEIGLCRDVAQAAGGRVVSLAGQTDLATLAALFSKSALFVGNDSGPLHLAAAAGTRVLAFFGPTVPEFGFAPPAGTRTRIVSRSLSCRPCAVHGSRACPLGHHACMKKIMPDEAWTLSKELLRAE